MKNDRNDIPAPGLGARILEKIMSGADVHITGADGKDAFRFHPCVYPQRPFRVRAPCGGDLQVIYMKIESYLH